MAEAGKLLVVDETPEIPDIPEVPPAREVGTLLVGCFILIVFAVIFLIVLSVVTSAAT